MAESNEELLRQLDTAIKGITTITTLGESVLPPEKFSEFVRVLQEPTVVLKDARRIDMVNGRADIDRIGFMGRIVRSGGVLSAQSRTGTQAQTEVSTSNYISPTMACNKLNGREFVAVVGLLDQVLKRNIERGNFENTLIQLLGEAAGKDMEETGLLAHLDYTGAQSGLELTDGWVEMAGNAVYGTYGDKSGGLDTTIKTATTMAAGAFTLSTTADLTSLAAGTFFRVGVPGSATIEFFTVASADTGDDTITFTTPATFAHAALEPVVQIDALPAFNPYAATYPENVFDAMIAATPKKYMQDKTRWAFYVPWEVMNAYQDLLKARNTQLGDQAQTSNPKLFYKGIAVKETPLIDRSEAYNASTKAYGQVLLLTSMDNLAWGIEADVKIEPQRVAVARRTDFVLTFSFDVGYEDEDAATAAFTDVPAPAAT